MADAIDAMEQVRKPEARATRRDQQVTLEQRIRQLAPFAAAAKIQVVQRWRHLWKPLPADSTDYAAAADVLGREIPQIDADIKVYTSLMDLGDYPPGYKPGTG
jgi:inorganic triphosphatase YgiF